MVQRGATPAVHCGDCPMAVKNARCPPASREQALDALRQGPLPVRIAARSRFSASLK
ncbi:DUF6233 domain-containing protein [Streptomyces sp. NPDC085596]|uniref:DUF6233 domain-containing protein n=1 Tax=Streptomyces sp. NPDC085596 TaxID=3365731 RepID=UPI0037D6528F